MNNNAFTNGIRFIVLVLAQVLICNHIHFLGFISPYIYVLFILLYPLKNENRALFLFLSFLMGLSVDFFSDSGGINAAASLCIAYIRPVVLRFSFGSAYEYQTLKISNTNLGQRFTYLSIMILTHHLILFWLEIFSFTHIFTTLKKALLSGAFTLLLCFLFIPLFRTKNQ
ncbi:rod shape-determining protein MreD [Sinomicrobium weinanense]|uniref:Rod shape-determining protein MreD n=1 Tax=Sinomicrobium weinanense TaxID=2842200 RepID=A0A926JUU9_9FLAO|nr:rod shape-determining protein MreD [Sinomicrobium weinanense]MBC9797729.1 rod shape-determining protein MreD [Sinomicrobium weinanense]MBU3123620.1 rod shape-determining protein MreD [Sinomicrobium weinanense]